MNQPYLMRGGAEAARQAHNLEVGGSNPPPAIIKDEDCNMKDES